MSNKPIEVDDSDILRNIDEYNSIFKNIIEHGSVDTRAGAVDASKHIHHMIKLDRVIEKLSLLLEGT